MVKGGKDSRTYSGIFFSSISTPSPGWVSTPAFGEYSTRKQTQGGMTTVFFFFFKFCRGGVVVGVSALHTGAPPVSERWPGFRHLGQLAMSLIEIRRVNRSIYIFSGHKSFGTITPAAYQIWKGVTPQNTGIFSMERDVYDNKRLRLATTTQHGQNSNTIQTPTQRSTKGRETWTAFALFFLLSI